MSKFIILSALIGLSSLVSAETNNNAAMSVNDLSEQFRLAHEKRDYETITGLINWDGVRKPMRKKVQVHTMATFGLDISDITIEQAGENQYKQVTIGNKTVKPNLPVSHIMKVHFDVEETIPEATGKDTVVYLLGKKDEQYMISVYVKQGKFNPYHD